MTDSKIYQMIGLTQKARMLVSGEFSCKDAVLKQKAMLVIVATDASKNTKKLFLDKTAYRNISCKEWGTKEGFGRMLGCDERAVVALTDINFATKISQMIEETV